MANIAITTRCNLDCAYCFAQETLAEIGADHQYMSREIFRRALAFIHRSGIEEIRILGGEPTLHPQFMELMTSALATSLPIRLFTNGLMPAAVVDFLSPLDRKQINIIVNLTRFSLAEKQDDPVYRVVEILGDKVTCGLNIVSTHQNMHPLLGIIERYNLQKNIRLGIAHPCMGQRNEHLPTRQLIQIGSQIAELAFKARGQNVRLILDCGFTPCMFMDYDITSLALDAEMGTHCQPIPDILPDGRAIPCFALAEWGKMDGVNSTAALIGQSYAESLRPFESLGIFKACSVCDDRRNNHCTGGGVCRKMSRLSVDKRSVNHVVSYQIA